MYFDFLKKTYYCAVIISGRFCVVSSVRSNQLDYKYLPKVITIDNKKKIKCNFILNHQDYDTAIIEVPDVPDAELSKAISWEAVKLFGDKSNNLIFDFYFLPSSHNSHKKLVNVIAVEKNHIDFIKEKSKSENIVIKKITVPEIVYKSAIVPNVHDDSFCVVLANKDVGKIVIVDKGEIYFSRRFNLSYDKKVEEVNYESIILLELQRSLDYYERQYRMVMPRCFFVVGNAVSNSLVSLLRDNVSQKMHGSFFWDNLFEEEGLSSDHRFLLSTSCLQKRV